MDFSRLATRWHRTLLLVSIVILVCVFIYLNLDADDMVLIEPGLAEEDLQLFSAHAIDNTVMIVAVNTGMLHWAANLLCSLESTSLDASKIIFWALDENAKQVIEAKGLTAYHDPGLFATSMNENKQGNTASYNRMMKERPKFFIQVLSAGFDLLMIDADTVWWETPFSIVPLSQDRSSVDMVYSTDAREFYQEHDAFRDEWRRGPYVPPVCNGIFWMKSTPGTISIWSDMLDVFEAPWYMALFQPRGFQDDQRGMDVLLNDGRAQVVGPLPGGISAEQVPVTAPRPGTTALNVRLLDQTRVANGQLLMNRRSAYAQYLHALRVKGQERLAAHFNWDTTVVTKEDGAKELSLMFLDEHGVCSNT